MYAHSSSIMSVSKQPKMDDLLSFKFTILQLCIKLTHLCLSDVPFRVSEATNSRYCAHCRYEAGTGNDTGMGIPKTQSRAEREPEEGFCLPRLTCFVTQANEQQLDSSQLTVATRLRPREMKRGGRRK